ncbi:hypothetical protein [Nonomuraea recticatena]|uniref:hypothetical protein n=1 Tax=Nonomuraea recticatena TaxID=46178 RepID=UPI00361E37ED
MHSAQVLPDGSRIRWVEIAGVEPTLVFVHGLGASSAPTSPLWRRTRPSPGAGHS